MNDHHLPTLERTLYRRIASAQDSYARGRYSLARLQLAEARAYARSIWIVGLDYETTLRAIWLIDYCEELETEMRELRKAKEKRRHEDRLDMIRGSA
jgi:hypothetical protein